MPREVLLDLIFSVREDIERPTKRSNALPVHIQVLVCLRYLSKGTFLSETADLHGVSVPSASRCISAVSLAINKNFSNKIKFPTHNVTKVKGEFYDLSHFPNVVGVVDGTLIPIVAPSEDEPAFICRKNYHAINVQAVTDANLRFINVVSRWPGSAHDSFIWRNSSIAHKLESGEVNGWVLGDSGYALRPWLLTPKANPITPGDRNYNRSFKTTRCIVERAFGVLKSRYRCLHKSGGCMLFRPKKCCNVIVTAFILHNICIDYRLPEPELLEEDDEDDEDGDERGRLYRYECNEQDGETARQQLIEHRFT